MVVDLRPALGLLSAHATGFASAPPNAGPAVPSLNDTFGALAIGTFVGLALYGISMNQAMHYFRKYTKDPLIIKFMIVFLVVLNTFHSICCMHASYYYGVRNFFKPQALLFGVWSIQILTPISGLIFLITQSFYVWRIYRLGYRYIFVVIPLVLLMASTAGFIVAATGELFLPSTFAQSSRYTWLISAGLGCALATDLVVCATLITSLARSDSAFKRENSALTVLLVCTVNTGFLTSALTMLSLVLSLAYTHNLVFVGVSMLTTKSYVHAVLAVVNSRRTHVESTAQTAAFGAFGLTAQIHTSKRGLPWKSVTLPHPRKPDVPGVQWKLPSAAAGSDGDNLRRGTDTAPSRGRGIVEHEHERDSERQEPDRDGEPVRVSNGAGAAF
ncbi:hypothetical protein LXA43DRAFT_1186174 [Ganoderma leucocontextum]|nr:hypothetical protein LXA43DRAFT_1186174 [Ganoderma leucocontextum]